MSLSFASFVLLVLNFSFLNSIHPLVMSLFLFMNTGCICLIMSFISWNPWFSYILYLVFIGGVLILLFYVISLISNITLESGKKEGHLLLTLLGMIIFYFIQFSLLIKSKSFDFENVFVQNFDEDKMICVFYYFPINIMLLFLITYLFVMLIVVTKITLTLFGPLRICKYLNI